MELYPHKSGLGLMEPVAQINHNVAILWNDTWNYYRVTYLEPIPPFEFLDIGAIAAQTVSAAVQANNLDLEEDEFGQFRWWPLDNAQIRLFLPNAVGRFKLQALQATVDLLTPGRDPCLHLTEFFEWEDERPWFLGINGMDYALTQCRLVGMGYRYKVAKGGLSDRQIATIKAGREPCVYVVCQGRA